MGELECLWLLRRISEARTAMTAASDIASHRFEELSERDIWAMRYQLIVLAEALASLCMRVARKVYGLVPASYRECLIEVGRRLGVPCIDDLSALIGLRNILVHRYFEVDDRRVHGFVRGNFTCVAEFLARVESHVQCAQNR